MAGGFSMLGLYACLGRRPGLSVLAGLFVFTACVETARLSSPRINEFFFRRFKSFLRDNEKSRPTGTPWYVLGAGLTLFLYDVPVGAYAVVFLACGDVTATMVGERWGRTKIVSGKSLEGTAAFIVAALIAGTALDAFFYPVPAVVFVVGAVVAAAVELLPPRINDNLAIPVISGAVMLGILMFIS
jgi:diacylglycerol kinase (CTP)